MVSNEEDLKKNIRKTGTATIGIKCREGIVIGADTRVSLGNTYIIGDKKVDKVFQLIDNIVVTTAGNASDVQFVMKLARAELRLKTIRTKKLPSVKESANLFASMLYQNIRRLSPIASISHFLIGGKDSTGFRLFEATPDGCIFEHEDYVTSGAFGSMFVWPLLKEKWSYDLSIQQTRELVIRILRSCIEHDASVGDPINIVTIDQNGVGKIEQVNPFQEEKAKIKKQK